LIFSFTSEFVLLGLLAFLVVIFARFIAVALLVSWMRRSQLFSRGAVCVMTWGGLRGGVLVALALSIPLHYADGAPIHERDTILTITYVVVVLSIIVQGLTIGPLVRRTML